MDIHLTGSALLLLAATPVAMAQGSLPKEVCEAFDLYVSLPDSIVPILREAKDRTSADKAAAKLHAVLPRLYEARTAVSHIRQLGPEATQELERRYGKRAQTGWGAVYQEIFRLQKTQCFGSLDMAKEFNLFCMMLK